ncbi:cytochrome-c peroxidase [Nannocystis pusilla]|uniref:cytochrome-c peroxidase n=1 Tax=Nannocystis pusilla TaxID=889268 RepID=UPI003B7E3F98
MHRALLTLALAVPLACDEPADPAPFMGDDAFVRDPALDVELVSAHGDAISHAAGDNCMRCHQENGPGPGRFTAAGTLHDEAGAPYPDGLVELRSAPTARATSSPRSRSTASATSTPPRSCRCRPRRCSPRCTVPTVRARTSCRSPRVRAPATSATPAASACASRRAEVRRAVAVCFAMLLGACPEDQAPAEAPWEWQLPPGFPEPFVPEDDPMSAAKVELGRHIFYDERLSYNETMACATCHEQARAFTDGKPTPIGSTGHAIPRNSMSLTNVAFQSVYTWANPKLSTLEEQALVPMFADFPLELGVQQDTDAVVRRFADDPEYQELFAAAWPEDDDPFTVERIVQALSSFQRTLISGDSAYDRFIYGGDSTAMSESAQRGMALFFSETGECYHCHAGANFSTSFRSAGTEPGPPDFQNNGLYNLDDAGAYPPATAASTSSPATRAIRASSACPPCATSQSPRRTCTTAAWPPSPRSSTTTPPAAARPPMAPSPATAARTPTRARWCARSSCPRRTAPTWSPSSRASPTRRS